VRAEVNNHFVMATRVLVNRDRCGLYIPLKVSTVDFDQCIYIVVFYSYLMQLVWWPACLVASQNTSVVFVEAGGYPQLSNLEGET
jgi:hypothetical protein